VGRGLYEGEPGGAGGNVRLTGSRCRCAGCGEHFNSVSVFDRHRVGDWQDSGARRRCLSVPEMQARNWSQNASGFWTERAFENARERIDRARSSRDRTERIVRTAPKPSAGCEAIAP
jgi:hypothetical protein